MTIKTNIDENSAKLFRGIITNYLDIIDINIDLCVKNEVKTVLSEMISNVLVHAYPESENKPAIITFDHKKENSKLILTMIVEDDGVGIVDIKKCMEPMYTTVKDESRCGLGFTIMETMSDKLLVTSNPNFGTRVLAEKCLATNLDVLEN